MATFDKSRDYGEIFGDAQGRRYVQDGLYFDANGKQIGGEKPAETKPKRVSKPAVPAPQPVADDQLKAQLEE